MAGLSESHPRAQRLRITLAQAPRRLPPPEFAMVCNENISHRLVFAGWSVMELTKIGQGSDSEPAGLQSPSRGLLFISRREEGGQKQAERLWASSRVAAACFSLFQEQDSGAMAGGAGKRIKHPRARTGTDTLQAHTRPDETLEAADEGAEAVGRSIELVFGDGQEEQGG